MGCPASPSDSGLPYSVVPFSSAHSYIRARFRGDERHRAGAKCPRTEVPAAVMTLIGRVGGDISTTGGVHWNVICCRRALQERPLLYRSPVRR